MATIDLTPQANNVASATSDPALPSGLVLGGSGAQVRLTGSHTGFSDTTVTVSAVSASGSTSAGKALRVVVNVPVATPQALKADKVGNDAQLLWSYGTGNVQRVKIYRSSTSTVSLIEANLVATLEGNPTTWTDVGGSTVDHWYVVQAVSGTLAANSSTVQWLAPEYNAVMTSLAPIAWWKMDETNVSDNAMATNLGTVSMNGQYSNAAGTVARAAIIRKGSLGGVQVTGNGSSYFKCFYSSNLPILNALNQGQSFTTMFWFRPTSIAGGLLLQVWGGSGGGRLNIYNTGANHPISTNRFTYTSPALNVPHFVCLIKDVAAGTYRMMIDGAWLTPAGAYSDLAIAGNDQMAISGRAVNSPQGMPGVYSDLAFFNKALTTAQVDALYNAGKL